MTDWPAARSILLVVLWMICGASQLSAQDCPLPIGTRLRVARADTAAPLIKGRLATAPADTLALRPVIGPVRRVPIRELVIVERWDGRDRQGGAAIGAVGGAFGGMLVGALWFVRDWFANHGELGTPAGDYAAVGGLIGVAVFGGLGWLIGGERWVPVPCVLGR
jgi:hypothetical protein